MSVVCLGEAVVDLICPRPLDNPAHADRFDPHFGGALANTAIAARRAGAEVILAGGVGDDPFGRMLIARLAAEGVDLSFFGSVPGVPTPFAFVTLDALGEPSFRIHGDGIEAGVRTLAGREEELTAAASSLVLGSNTLVEEQSRSVTFAAVRCAGRDGVPILFDPNLRPARWSDLARARGLCLEIMIKAKVVKANLAEARWLAGLPTASASEAAEALAAIGPDLAVVTDGPGPVLSRGWADLVITPPPSGMISPLGAGDAFMGALAASLPLDDPDPEWIRAALEAATRAGAAACGQLGAID